ncbi:M48 family metallopeptidase [Sporomusa sp. KB1]|uniref:M48 family metallopeptidase n=1 Tax=Sporomusa sp. KB1 TaxID=943346 RepID=UPI0011ACAB54|nr:M48 family metallopeptidase [Sporomusa sp. KB1]TWH47752.1 peptidase M48-like protein [Sporomusa sp. KB1]
MSVKGTMRLKKGIVICLIALLFVMSLMAQYKVAEAASLGQRLLYAGIAVTFVNTYFNHLNDRGQKDILANTKKQTGVYNDEQANTRIYTITKRLKSSGLIKENYAIYANPKKEFNAFCTLGHVISVNKGALDSLDDDELAVVIAHEMRHGEAKHPVQGVTKAVGIGLAVDIYLSSNKNNASYILSGIAGNYINNEMFTMDQEWEADNYGFEYVTAAGYNPGGPAASMVKMRFLLGDLWREGLARTVNPNNHPKTTARINNFAKKMTNYSEGHITVKNDKTVQIDGQEIMTPVKTDNYFGEERAYLMAGCLAQVYHNHELAAAYIGDNGAVYIGERQIITTADNDISAAEIVNKINSIIKLN